MGLSVNLYNLSNEPVIFILSALLEKKLEKIGWGPLFFWLKQQQQTNNNSERQAAKNSNCFLQCKGGKRTRDRDREVVFTTTFSSTLSSFSLFHHHFSPSLSLSLSFIAFSILKTAGAWGEWERDGGCKLSKKWKRRRKKNSRTEKKSGLSTHLETGFVSKLRDSPSSRMRYKKN